ncbi:MAG: transcription-repair coupling factor, partial [Bacteroidota bacterium]
MATNLERLSQHYQNDERVQQIAEAAKATDSRIRLLGMSGASDAFFLAATYRQAPQNYLYIVSDKEEAAYAQNNLAALFEQKSIHFFPDSFKRPRKFEELDNNNVLLRTETIHKISSSKGKGEIVVTYP